MEEVLSCVQRKVTEEQNRELMWPFESEEVKEAIFSMHPDKSPGEDGLNPAFFQKSWSIMGSAVTESVIHWLTIGVFPESLLDTILVLLPKK